MATAKKAAKKKSRRTVMYSTGGKKLYAVRDASGKFKDIQQYSRAHAMDIKRGSSAETTAAATTAAKRVANKAAAGKKTVRKAVTKVAKKAAKRATSAKKTAGSLLKRVRRAVAKVRAKL